MFRPVSARIAPPPAAAAPILSALIRFSFAESSFFPSPTFAGAYMVTSISLAISDAGASKSLFLCWPDSSLLLHYQSIAKPVQC